MKALKSNQMFLSKEGQQLDFSSGKVDVVDIFNNVIVPTVNKLEEEEEQPISESDLNVKFKFGFEKLNKVQI